MAVFAILTVFVLNTRTSEGVRLPNYIPTLLQANPGGRKAIFVQDLIILRSSPISEVVQGKNRYRLEESTKLGTQALYDMVTYKFSLGAT